MRGAKRGESIAEEFNSNFVGRTSDAFDADKDFEKVGVVNQTTMIAAETTKIAEIIKRAVGDKGSANTRDTLCYATNDNQKATYGALEDAEADLALVVGGYNSSNTTHIVELCEKNAYIFREK